MSKKIMLFSRDPGGANAVAPLINELLIRGYEVNLYGKDAALKKYEQYGLKGIDLSSIINNITKEEIYKFLIIQAPDFLITGTSSDDFTEKYLWSEANSLNIKCFAILDHWVNYGIRFSDFDLSRIEEYNKRKLHPYLPYKILVMDDYAKDKVIEEGIKEDKIFVSGHPYFDYLLERKEQLNMKDIINLKDSLIKGKNKLLITFVSEPISKMYRGKDSSKYYLGYSEKTIFHDFFKVLNRLAEKYEVNMELVIRLHPKEDIDSFKDIIKKINSKYVSFIVDNKLDGLKLICCSDLICGMTSMLLIEAVILGKQILSMQMGLSKENSFILDKLGVTKSILSEEELEENLEAVLINKKNINQKFNIETGSVKKIIGYMEEILCQY